MTSLENVVTCVTQLYKQYGTFLSGEPSYPEIEQEMGRYIYQQVDEVDPEYKLKHPTEIKHLLQSKIENMTQRLITHNNRLIVKKVDDLWVTLVQDTLFNLILKHLGVHVLYEENDDTDSDEPLKPLDVTESDDDSESE
jgi:hypothetical protein